MEAPLAVHSAFYAPGSSAKNQTVLRGAAATKVKINLTPYVKASAAGEITDVALLPSVIGVQFGPVMTPATFSFSDATSFVIEFELARNALSLLKCVYIANKLHR
jgi:hypothetical protein